MTPAPLRSIAIVDVRDGGVVRHARESAARARALRDECLAWFPAAARPFVPLADRLARRWLTRSCSPYVGEVESIAATLGFPGIWLLNGSYEWGCTSLARTEDGVPWLARTLDWPFHGLGRHVDVARMRGPAGEFFSVTWPGYVGTLTAMAPSRFAAALNQAPMWRRTRRPWLRLWDLAANAMNTWRLRHMPPDQLLRNVFETCRSFDEARQRLETTPVARPVIFILAGCKAGERCVIERTENGCTTRSDETCAANDWNASAEPWEGRIASDLLLHCSYAEARANSRGRREALARWAGCFARDSFGWVAPPVLNFCTRLAVEMCPSAGTLRVVGYEVPPAGELPVPVTQRCEVKAAQVASELSSALASVGSL